MDPTTTAVDDQQQGPDGKKPRWSYFLKQPPAGPTFTNRVAPNVDAEGRATRLRLWSASRPHMLAFHLSWVAFCAAFCSTLATTAMMPVIRADLGLTQTDVGNMGVSTASGIFVSRLIVGSMCDTIGPRYGFAISMLLSSSAVYGVALVRSATSLIIAQFFVGFSLSSFVSCQFWCTVMFSPAIVGAANGLSAGWGNSGGGLAQLALPYIETGLQRLTGSDFTSWRVVMFLPATVQVVIALAMLAFAWDLPGGKLHDVRKAGGGCAGSMPPPRCSPWWGIWCAGRNYRVWVLALVYGCSFGLNLVLTTMLTSYFVEQFELSLNTAAVLASISGLQNIYARALGGWLSDVIGSRAGMRGKLWMLYLATLASGLLTAAMGVVSSSFATSMVLLLVLSIVCPMANGAAFGVVPSLSHRALGMVMGIVGAGGCAGGLAFQMVFLHVDGSFGFIRAHFLWLGVSIALLSNAMWTVWFPHEGGMVTPPRPGADADDYHSSDYTQAEREAGRHRSRLPVATAAARQGLWAMQANGGCVRATPGGGCRRCGLPGCTAGACILKDEHLGQSSFQLALKHPPPPPPAAKLSGPPMADLGLPAASLGMKLPPSPTAACGSGAAGGVGGTVGGTEHLPGCSSYVYDGDILHSLRPAYSSSSGEGPVGGNACWRAFTTCSGCSWRVPRHAPAGAGCIVCGCCPTCGSPSTQCGCAAAAAAAAAKLHDGSSCSGSSPRAPPSPNHANSGQHTNTFYVDSSVHGPAAGPSSAPADATAAVHAAWWASRKGPRSGTAPTTPHLHARPSVSGPTAAAAAVAAAAASARRAAAGAAEGGSSSSSGDAGGGGCGVIEDELADLDCHLSVCSDLSRLSAELDAAAREMDAQRARRLLEQAQQQQPPATTPAPAAAPAEGSAAPAEVNAALAVDDRVAGDGFHAVAGLAGGCAAARHTRPTGSGCDDDIAAVAGCGPNPCLMECMSSNALSKLLQGVKEDGADVVAGGGAA